ncbi:MAG: endolytic transglycosylase MltG [Clostridia bacterium]|nr:endolytic transglycosylase MltG [Clostridia bacterium]
MKKKYKVLLFIISVLLTAALASGAVIAAANDVFALCKSGSEKTFALGEETALREGAQKLKEEGIIAFPLLFRIYFSMKSEARTLPAGEYTLSPAMSYDEIRYELFGIGRERTQVRITVPEGYTTDEIIELFLENGIGTRAGFEEAIAHGEFDFGFVSAIPENPARKYRLDGYLFPDTYMFFSDSSEEEAIAKMLANFERKFTATMASDAARAGYSIDEAVILASMVQREAYYLSDMAGISSVFRNRLRGGMKYLQSDATALYGDTYDTYKNAGLPPGAICNPGAAALEAAVYPANTKYYYFLTGNDKKAVFSRTYAEHKRAVARWKKGK